MVKTRKIPLDKEEFLNIALNKGFEMGDIQDFIADYFENLRSINWNLRRLKEEVKLRKWNTEICWIQQYYKNKTI